MRGGHQTFTKRDKRGAVFLCPLAGIDLSFSKKFIRGLMIMMKKVWYWLLSGTALLPGSGIPGTEAEPKVGQVVSGVKFSLR